MANLKKYKVEFRLPTEKAGYFDEPEIPVKGTTYFEARSGKEAFMIANGLFGKYEYDITEVKNTCELVNELLSREAVQRIPVEPYKSVKISVDGKEHSCEIEQGPCSILVVYD